MPQPTQHDPTPQPPHFITCMQCGCEEGSNAECDNCRSFVEQKRRKETKEGAPWYAYMSPEEIKARGLDPIAASWTPEPWGIDLESKIPGQKHGICITPEGAAYVLLPFADYERATICVNACKGTASKELQWLGQHNVSMSREVRALYNYQRHHFGVTKEQGDAQPRDV